MVLQPHLDLGVGLGVGLALAVVALAGACGKDGASVPPPDAGVAVSRGDAPSRDERPAARPDARVASPAPDDPPAAGEEELHVDGVRLRLSPAECVLTARFLDEVQRHRFAGFPGACHFAPDRDGQPWVVATEHGKAVLVQSGVPRDAGDCDTALQVVVITERGPALSREIQRVSGCGPGPWDELMYHVLASDRVPLGGG